MLSAVLLGYRLDAVRIAESAGRFATTVDMPSGVNGIGSRPSSAPWRPTYPPAGCPVGEQVARPDAERAMSRRAWRDARVSLGLSGGKRIGQVEKVSAPPPSGDPAQCRRAPRPPVPMIRHGAGHPWPTPTDRLPTRRWLLRKRPEADVPGCITATAAKATLDPSWRPVEQAAAETRQRGAAARSGAKAGTADNASRGGA